MKRRQFFIAIALALTWVSGAFAQVSVTTNPAPWSQIGATTPLSASVTSSSVALPAYSQPPPPTANVCNTGTVTVYVALGDITVVATSNNTQILAGTCRPLALNGATYLAAITASSTATVTVELGSGTSASVGGTGSGSGMTPSASNAVLPDARNNLGLGTANTPAFAGAVLNSTHSSSGVVAQGLYGHGSWVGSVTSGQAFFNELAIDNDTVNTTGAGGPGGAIAVYIGENLGSASLTGGRTTLESLLNLTHATGNGAANRNFYVAGASVAQASANDGGTNTTGAGNFFAGNDSAALQTGATYFNSIVGREIDIGVATGATKVSYKEGLKIVQLGTGGAAVDAIQGTTADFAVGIVNQIGASTYWLNGIIFGEPDGIWAIDPTNGTMIGTLATALGGHSYAAKYGIDFSSVTFSSGFLNSTGFLVDGSGNTTTNGLVVGSPTGGSQGTGTVNATGLFVNGVAVTAGFPTTANGLGSDGAAFLPWSFSANFAETGTTWDLTSREDDCTSGTCAASGSAAIASSDSGAYVKLDAHAYTIVRANTAGFTSGFSFCGENTGTTGNATITATTSVWVGAGGTTLATIEPGASFCARSNGTDYEIGIAHHLGDGPSITPTALSGNVNDYNPTNMATARTIRQDGGAADRNITGIAGGFDNRRLRITNIGSTNNLIIVDQSASSAAANRFQIGANITIGINKSRDFYYDGTVNFWRPADVALANTVTAGSCGDATHSCGLTYAVDGRITAASNNALTSSGTTVVTAFVTSEFDATSTTDVTIAGADITGMSLALSAGKNYACHGFFPATAPATGGIKIIFTSEDGLTFTSGAYSFATSNSFTNSSSTTMGSAIGNSNVINTGFFVVDAFVQINAGGHMLMRGAQNTSNGTKTAYLPNGYLACTQQN
ncbi:MAG: hypothetical protein EPO09_21765 [Aquabacterium sp.]|uniref:beta strand repeat-containing protein n=1 Tax=Aquabacterium sp. TaxID=1872578 RepID=UPI001217F3A3|nr:hypothetical protein [Aquabacterium sp.]TAK81881.1 MAG: hypothetical protein EPO09_21765 [Aquabacterium sp.]